MGERMHVHVQMCVARRPAAQRAGRQAEPSTEMHTHALLSSPSVHTQPHTSHPPARAQSPSCPGTAALAPGCRQSSPSWPLRQTSPVVSGGRRKERSGGQGEEEGEAGEAGAGRQHEGEFVRPLASRPKQPASQPARQRQLPIHSSMYPLTHPAHSPLPPPAGFQPPPAPPPPPPSCAPAGASAAPAQSPRKSAAQA